MMRLKNTKVGFIGSGNMAEALIKGVINSGLLKKSNLLASDIIQRRRVYIKGKYGVRVTADNKKIVRESDIIILAVKPQNVKAVLQGIAPHFAAKQSRLGVRDNSWGNPSIYSGRRKARPERSERVGNKLTRKQLLISIVAGLNSGAIQKLCPEVQVIRVMPNIPALIGQGMSAFCRGKRVATAYSGTAKKILGAVGKVVEVKEDLMDAITALSGSGPAYFFYLIEALTEAGEKIGIKKKMARELAVQTALGSAGLLAQTGLDPAQLRRKVTSKGGTTQAALNVFEKGELKQLVKKAVVAARNRSRELSK